MDTKFAKPSILGKPVLQPPRNQSVVRQPNAFKSKRPNFSKPRFASQVDVNNVLSKPVTPHYFPKVQEYVCAKSHHVITPHSSKNSQEESYGSNDMTHNHYLEEARKKTQKNRNSKTSFKTPTKNDYDSLFQPMFDEYFIPPPNVDHLVPEVPAPVPTTSTSSPSSTTINQDAPLRSTPQTTSEKQSSVIPQGIEDDFHNIEVAHMDNNPYFGILIL
nr:hypothetical protein [Tanacetum cinerariifolium]